MTKAQQCLPSKTITIPKKNRNNENVVEDIVTEKLNNTFCCRCSGPCRLYFVIICLLVISIFICCRCSGPCQRRKDSEMPPGHRSELNQHLRICWEYAYCAKLSLSFFDRTNRTNLQKIVFCFTWKTFTLFTKQLGLACQSDQMIIR